MKKIISTLLLLTLLLGACSPAASSTETTSTESATQPSAESTESENSEPAEAGREAVLSEIENNVAVQIESSAEFSSAKVGMVIPTGGTIQTGDDSRAKLDLNPDGTIIRVGPNSSFTFSEITEENDEPKTTLDLLFGKVFILLNGGSLDVQTPSGVASVRGSLLSVQYDPNTNRVRASCLEGHCGLENEDGEEVEITEGESVFVDEEGDLSEITEIDQDEIFDWLEENPELYEFMEELPDPEDYPDYEDDEWYIEWTYEEFPIEEFPTEEFPTEEFPTEEFPTEEPSTQEAPTEEPPAEDPPPDEPPPTEEPPPDGG